MKTRQLIEKSFLTLVLLLLSATMAVAQSSGTTKLRRPITPERPLWIIHVDTWNAPDPERIIELVPKTLGHTAYFPYLCQPPTPPVTTAMTCVTHGSKLLPMHAYGRWCSVPAAVTAVSPTTTSRYMRTTIASIPTSSDGTLPSRL